MPQLLSDAVGIAIVGYVITVSLGKLFARKYAYRIDPDQVCYLCEKTEQCSNAQEWYALGIINVVGSFLHIFPASGAPARTMVYEGAGVRTQVRWKWCVNERKVSKTSQIANIFTVGVLAAVIILAGPLFEQLPMVTCS